MTDVPLSKSGVAVQIKSEGERALYTHCYAHI